MATQMARAAYAGMNGPTTGDAMRLADTGVRIGLERDVTRHGDRATFGVDGIGDVQLLRIEGAVNTGFTDADMLGRLKIGDTDICKDSRITKREAISAIDVDLETDVFAAGGAEITCEPARSLPIAQCFFF